MENASRELKASIVELLHENPQTSVRQIAEAAGVSYSTVYVLARKNGLQRDGRERPKQPISPEVESQILDALIAAPKVDRNLRHAVAHRFGVKSNIVKRLASKHGLLPDRNVQELHVIANDHHDDEDITVLSEIEAELARTKRRLEELERRKTELQIRIEPDGNDIIVYGIGNIPFRAPWPNWLTFLNTQGAARLRETIQNRNITRLVS